MQSNRPNGDFPSAKGAAVMMDISIPPTNEDEHQLRALFMDVSSNLAMLERQLNRLDPVDRKLALLTLRRMQHAYTAMLTLHRVCNDPEPPA
jgi:hypothetical protein